MENLPSGDIELLMTYEKLARALESMHLNHEQRSERIALLGRMLRAPMQWATPDFLKWLYPLYHLLLTLYVSPGSSRPMTHTEVKHGLRFFAEICEEARKDLETIEANRRAHGSYWFTVATSDSTRSMPADGEIVDYKEFGVPPATQDEVDAFVAERVAHKPDGEESPIGGSDWPTFDPHIDELLARPDSELTDDDRRYLANAIGIDYDTGRSADGIDEEVTPDAIPTSSFSDLPEWLRKTDDEGDPEDTTKAGPTDAPSN